MDYKKEESKELIIRLKQILDTLPNICSEFFLSIAQTTSLKTRLGYAYDIRLFFDYIIKNIDDFANIKIKNITADNLKKVTYLHIDLFLDYISYHSRKNKTSLGKDYSVEHINNEKGKARKLSAIRRFFAYLYKVGKINSDPAQLIDTPKLHKKDIIYLNKEEVGELLDTIENGTKLTKTQQIFHNYTKTRDFAIICLLLGTGIRISECIGINMQDIDFSEQGIKIVRKGGNESIVYFGEEVYNALCAYFDEREEIEELEGHEDALFLSLQKKRINARTVQKLVKKYSNIATPLKNISPHKLRSTYGTALYEKTDDIYLVADALGHTDINTTKKYYAKIHEQRRKQAGLVTRLRENDE